MSAFAAYIGYDPREVACYAVARASLKYHSVRPTPVRSVSLVHLRNQGLYYRPTDVVDGKLWDRISGAPMSTEFAISRFLVPHMRREGFAVFMDCDVLVRRDIWDIMRHVDPSKAVSVVKHDYQPPEGVKMDGQQQTQYARKNWSSVMVFNCDHPANKALDLTTVNTLPGRDLHRFCWLDDDQIGELPPEWNYLVGHTVLPAGVEPAIVHFTEGAPIMPGYEGVQYADEFGRMLRAWVD